MCRSIKTLTYAALDVTDADVRAATVQYVRKISGMRQPAAIHADAWNDAVRDITAASERLVATVRAGRTGASPLLHSAEDGN